jgi:hypothetical protein
VRTALVVAAVLCSATALVQTSTAAQRPVLRLVDDTVPASLRGSGFASREHVRIVIVAGGERSVRRTVATRLGRFVLRLTSVDVEACAGFSARAVGSDGSRASLKRAPGQCATP